MKNVDVHRDTGDSPAKTAITDMIGKAAALGWDAVFLNNRNVALDTTEIQTEEFHVNPVRVRSVETSREQDLVSSIAVIMLFATVTVATLVTDANSVHRDTLVTQWEKAASRHQYQTVIRKAPNKHFPMAGVSAKMELPEPTVIAARQNTSSCTTKVALNVSVWECQDRVPAPACSGIRSKHLSVMDNLDFRSFLTTPIRQLLLPTCRRRVARLCTETSATAMTPSTGDCQPSSWVIS